jgi:hypothetical protein
MNGIYGRLWLISCATSTPAPQLINRFPIIKLYTAPFAHPSNKTSSSPPVPHFLVSPLTAGVLVGVLRRVVIIVLIIIKIIGG